jgi:hypothetical protein
VRGEDRHVHFELEPSPEADLAPDAIAFYKWVRERRMAILMRGTAADSCAPHAADAISRPAQAGADAAGRRPQLQAGVTGPLLRRHAGPIFRRR